MHFTMLHIWVCKWMCLIILHFEGLLYIRGLRQSLPLSCTAALKVFDTLSKTWTVRMFGCRHAVSIGQVSGYCNILQKHLQVHHPRSRAHLAYPSSTFPVMSVGMACLNRYC